MMFQAVKKAGQVAEGAMRPHVQSAFERHLAIQADHRRGHGHIKRHHGAQPEQHLCAAQPRGHAHPRTAHHAQNLRQHQVAEAELSPQTVLRPGFDVRFRHRLKMVAHRRSKAPAHSPAVIRPTTAHVD